MMEELCFDGVITPYSPHGEKELMALSEQVGLCLQTLGAQNLCFLSFPAHQKELLDLLYKEIYAKITSYSGKNQVLFGASASFFQNQVINDWASLGITTKFLPASCGPCDLELLEKHLNPRVALFVLPWICPLTALVQPIDEIAEICKRKGVLFYLDASFALLERVFTIDALPCDFVSFAAKPLGISHDIQMLIGKGVLWKDLPEKTCLPDVKIVSQMQKRLREIVENIEQSIIEYSLKQELFEKKLLELFPKASILHANLERSSRITCFSIASIHQDMLLFYLQKMHVLARLGGGDLPLLKDILLARGVKERDAHTFISFQFEEKHTQEDIEKALKLIATAVEKLQMMSPI